MRNLRRVQLQLVGGVARTVGVHAELQVPNAYVHFVIEGDDTAVFLGSHSELGNGLRLDLQLRQFLVLGEAVKNLSDETRRSAPEVPWANVAGLRDLIAHEYFRIEMTRISR